MSRGVIGFFINHPLEVNISDKTIWTFRVDLVHGIEAVLSDDANRPDYVARRFGPEKLSQGMPDAAEYSASCPAYTEAEVDYITVCPAPSWFNSGTHRI